MELAWEKFLEETEPPGNPSRATLVVMNGPDDGRVFSLNSLPAVVGRLVSHAIALQFDRTVSRTHAQLTEEGGLFFLEDLGSRCGTELDRVRIHGRQQLRPGSMIQVGDTLLRFQVASRPSI